MELLVLFCIENECEWDIWLYPKDYEIKEIEDNNFCSKTHIWKRTNDVELLKTIPSPFFGQVYACEDSLGWLHSKISERIFHRA